MVARTAYAPPSADTTDGTLVVLPNQVIVLSTRADVEAFSISLWPVVNAIRMKVDGTEMQRSGFTYLLQKSNAGWRIHEIIATDVDKLISAD